MDLLTTPAWRWQEALAAGTTTSVSLVKAFVQRIDKHNCQNLCLKAIISVAPLRSLLEQAQKLDDERASGLRSPLHGVPIVVKDVFITEAALGMPTTCGTAALASAVGRQNSEVVERLLSAGLIIIGKANLTELCGLRGSLVRMGFSTLGGQTQSPFTRQGLDEMDTPLGNTNAGGSSSGSAVSVAAGFAPLSLGSDTSGSLTVPANRAGLYSLKITCDRASAFCTHMFRLSSCYDSVGGMARSARDLRDLTNALLGTRTSAREYYSRATPFGGFAVGFVDPSVWRYPDDMCFIPAEERARFVYEYENVSRSISNSGGSVVRGIELPSASTLFVDGKSIVHSVAYTVIPKLMEDFLSCLDESPVDSLDELITWNEDHPVISMATETTAVTLDQDELRKVGSAALKDSEMMELVNLGTRRAYENGIERALREHSIELLIGPADSPLYCLAAAAGCPIATMPLTVAKFDDHGEPGYRPDGLCVIGRRHSDEKILRFLMSYEELFHPCIVASRCR